MFIPLLVGIIRSDLNEMVFLYNGSIPSHEAPKQGMDGISFNDSFYSIDFNSCPPSKADLMT